MFCDFRAGVSPRALNAALGASFLFALAQPLAAHAQTLGQDAVEARRAAITNQLQTLPGQLAALDRPAPAAAAGVLGPLST